MLIPWGRWSERKEKMELRTSSCLLLYLLSCKATGQLFRTWRSDWTWPHRGHDEDGIFRHKHRFWLWGSVSVVALRANLKTLSGRDSTTVDQVVASLPSNVLTVCPWTTRPAAEVWFSLEAVSAACTRALAFMVVAALLAPGSSFIASTTVWNGLNGALVCRCSLRVSVVAIHLTVGSLECTKIAALETCSLRYRVMRLGRSRPPLLLGRNSLFGSAVLARPLHLFR